ncbi:FAD-dependent monooxygenase [Chelatococcus sp. GCM10030263]|uniref:FAD-dependent monooxygenase n=1 Tax=Chelatococcus sp. GCM10030263 TaxID=3273387 RepID=UPI00360B692C
MSDRNFDAEVLIVGAGPSGLSAAIELGMRGVSCLVVERSDRVGHAPRAKTTHARSREHMRRWGIAEKLAGASPFGVDYPANVHFVTRLGGRPIARFDGALACAPDRDPRYAEHGQWIPQYRLEAVLKDHAASLPTVRLAFGTEFLGLTQDDRSITATVRHLQAGPARTLTARYLVGADGPRSRVRDEIGSRMEGTAFLSRNYNIVFRAPGLAERHPHGPGIMFWQINTEVPSVIGPMDRDDLWYFAPTQVPEGVTYSKGEAADLIRRATGIDLPYEVLSHDEWVASRLLADSYRSGRAFLIGDACHLHPPFGGYGMNLGISDGVDIGWKLAAVLRGWGGPALLDSYQTERRRVHELVLDESVANHAVLANQLATPDIEDDTPAGAAARTRAAALVEQYKRAEFYSLGIVLGYTYAPSAVILDDGTQRDWAPTRDYVPAAIPGCRAPHVWLNGATSIFDLFGPGFTLLVLGQPGEDERRAEQEAAAAGIPLKVLAMDEGLRPLYGASRLLIRPDQHVSWRGARWPSGARSILSRVTGHESGPDTV